METAKIKDKIDQLNRKHSKIITNSYMGFLDTIVGGFNFYENANAILISYSDCGVRRLVFYSNDVEHLRALLSEMPAGEYIMEKADRIGFESDLDLCGAGFEKLKKLDRYSNNRIDELLGSDIPVLKYRGAVSKMVFTAAHRENVNRLLYETFDARISHLPDERLLSEQLDAGEFVGVMGDSEIVTLLQRRIEKKKFYINQIINKGEKKNIHAMLLNRLEDYINNGGKYLYAWVEDRNIASQKFHAKYGMKHDGMWNMVYRLERA